MSSEPKPHPALPRYSLEGIASSALMTTARALTPGQWGAVSITAALCLAVTYALARLLHVPAEPGFTGSLLAGPAVGVAAALSSIAAGLLIGRFASAKLGGEGAVFCATVGLVALAVASGPMRPVLMYANGRGIFGLLAAESAVLAVATWTGWAAVQRWNGQAVGDVRLAVPGEAGPASTGAKLAATGVAALITAAVELILVTTDGPKQCLAGLTVAAFAGGFAGYSYLPLATGVWYWTAPSVVAVVGYAVALATNARTPTGEVTGYLAALARPTPLHYASLGTAAAVLGHWAARESAEVTEPDQPTLADPETPTP